MPRYLYVCTHCPTSTELVRAIADRHQKEACPVLGCSGVLELAPSALGIAFKGSGFTPKSGKGRTK